MQKRVISNLNVNDIFDAIPSFDESGFDVYQSNISLEKKYSSNQVEQNT